MNHATDPAGRRDDGLAVDFDDLVAAPKKVTALGPWLFLVALNVLWILGMTSLVMLALLFFSGRSARAAVQDCIDATVRITNRSDNGMGSGCVFANTGGEYLILTNAHVAGSNVGNSVEVEFWAAGYTSNKFAGKVTHAWYTNHGHCDAAIVSVPVASVPVEIKPIPFAARGTVQSSSTICSVGCAQGAWSTAWKGHVVGERSGAAMLFQPPPHNGRSGSAIFDADGEHIIGLLGWRSNEDGIGSCGVAMHLDALYSCFDGHPIKEPGPGYQQQFMRFELPAQYCEGGNCNPNGGGGFGLELYRHRWGQAPRQNPNTDRFDPWAGNCQPNQQQPPKQLFPVPQPQPACQCNNAEMEKRLAAIEQKLVVVETLKQTPGPPGPPGPPGEKGKDGEVDYDKLSAATADAIAKKLTHSATITLLDGTKKTQTRPLSEPLDFTQHKRGAK